MPVWFYFMNFGWGKGFFLFFVGLILLAAGTSVTWVDILVGIWFILCGIVFAILSKVQSGPEKDFVKDMLDELEKQANEKDQ